MSSAIWTPQYYQKVMATDPFAYFMLDEKSSTVAYDMVSGRVAGAQNGAHTGVTLGQPGIGDGRTSPLYDGANDYTDVFTAAFSAAFNGSEGSILCWARVSGAGVWTDGAERRGVSIQIDADNNIGIQKIVADNTLRWRYEAGGTVEVRNVAGMTTTDWMALGLTWSKSADAVIAYLDGVQQGAVMAGLGNWAGAPVALLTNIGSFNQTPANPWDGTIDHVPFWNRALTPAEVADLAVIE